MNRRNFLGLAGMAASPLLAQTVEQKRRGIGSLKITKVEALVIRTPGDKVAPESLVTMIPLGATTGGAGLWNRLDHASPSRTQGHTQAVLVRISTDQGLTGWGECHAPEAPRVHQMMVTDLLGPVLLGQNALEVEPLWEKLYSTERLRGYSTGVYTEAIAGVDLALWDLLGQFVGQPVYRLLGGKFRDRIPSYEGIGGSSIADLKTSALKAVADGFTVVKISFSKGAGTNDIARVAAVAEVMKDKGQVLVDSLGAFKLYEAVKLGRELDKLGNVGWWEDPLMPDDLTSYPKLREALDTAICAGEELCNRFQFSEFLAAKSANIINPDVCRAGGITEVKRIATLAEAYGVMWAPHISTGTALYIAASMHVAASTSNLLISEGGAALRGPLGNDLLEEPIDWKPGWIGVPERPGLGVRFNATALAKVTAAGA
jgi:L-alanine-DL-glutamate epimerase-like enolase superfamily enzyme